MKLHLISPDIPFPPDYGGMVDVFYKIKNLHEAGVEIYLHCFEYGRGKPEALRQYCKAVYYYPRKTGLRGLSLTLPYMMYSRRDARLLANLQKTDAPILFEGVHCAYYLSHASLAGRLKLLRNQNLEQDYFKQLSLRPTGLFSKLYYRVEAALLQRTEARLHAADAFMTVALHDYDFFKKAYPDKTHVYIPSFQPYDAVCSRPGQGQYVLYQGNLGHPENIEAAMFLLTQVCGLCPDVQFVFAGKNPSEEIKAAIDVRENCSLIPNPDMDTMSQLVADAQVHVLPTFQATGLKLKLLHALFNGRHALVNEAMVAGTGIVHLCTQAETAQDFSKKIHELMAQPFTAGMIAEREAVLLRHYNNKANARRIIEFLL
ncbi:MAG: glycosyltransferase [Edaphocola sp.]